MRENGAAFGFLLSQDLEAVPQAWFQLGLRNTKLLSFSYSALPQMGLALLLGVQPHLRIRIYDVNPLIVNRMV